VVFYATALGCADAWLLYPRPVVARSIAVGPVRVHTLGFDLGDMAAWPRCRDALAGELDTLGMRAAQ
jgi:hypothetical protein